MEGGRVSHSWCMCVVVMAMVGWMGAGMELVLGRHAGQSQIIFKCYFSGQLIALSLKTKKQKKQTTTTV